MAGAVERAGVVATGGEEIELAGWAIDLTNLVVSPSRFDRNWGDDSYVCRANASYLQGYASRKAPAVNGYPFFQALPVDYTGAVLGFYSASVDDQKDDVHLWWRPTAFVPINAVFDAASDGLQGIIFVLAVPFFCLNSLFNSGNCLDDARNAARDADVITMLESEIPGVGDIDGDDMDVGGVRRARRVESTECGRRPPSDARLAGWLPPP